MMIPAGKIIIAILDPGPKKLSFMELNFHNKFIQVAVYYATVW